ncbi:cytochrome-c peroxidase [Lysobacter pythonis]|uniref:Methylamine utilization protein MauG n=2 Tax=Solilutibacter pythonis TaxID=2483112 RepID=A0A3M2I2X4_9GAMM|nr:cytochrome-c peroxidase [Lysobacter pythonis]
MPPHARMPEAVVSPADCTTWLRAPAPAEMPPGLVACLRRAYAAPPAQWPAPHVDAGVAWRELGPIADAPVPEPDDNPSSHTKIALGRRLFHDPRLSRSGQIACANCHEQALGWADGRRVAFGHDRQPGRRNAMSVAMAGYATTLFWDGRAASLEDQAMHPVEDPREMAFTRREMVARLRALAEYRAAFEAAFGSREVDERRISQALAAFQRSLAPRHGRFDRFLGGRGNALDDRQLLGLHLFRTRARCINCHHGPTLSDNRFHNLGLHGYGTPNGDLGRYEVTGDPADVGRFRTPSLRNVKRTGPWMHNGEFPLLEGVLRMYNLGMVKPVRRPGQEDDPLFPETDPLLRPLGLNETELGAIVSFLETL